MMVRARDRVVVESEKVGEAPRTGVVTAVEGRLLKIMWDRGGETAMVPAAGNLHVIGAEKKARLSKR